MQFLDLKPIARAAGSVKLPGSKSISNRALLLAALASGETRLHGLLDSDDTRVMQAALHALGIAVSKAGADTVVISGYMTQMCCDTTARQAFHLGFAVEFLSDATGTLSLANDAGSVTAEELHRAILVTQAALFSRVMTTAEWQSKRAHKN